MQRFFGSWLSICHLSLTLISKIYGQYLQLQSDSILLLKQYIEPEVCVASHLGIPLLTH